MMNNFDRMQKEFEESRFYFCGESPSDRIANWNVWKDAWKAGMKAQKENSQCEMSKEIK